MALEDNRGQQGLRGAPHAHIGSHAGVDAEVPPLVPCALPVLLSAGFHVPMWDDCSSGSTESFLCEFME